jgi:hypothetical protein
VRPYVAALMAVALVGAFGLAALGARVAARPGVLLSLAVTAVLGFFFLSRATESLLGGSLAETRFDELTDFYEQRRSFIAGGSRVERPWCTARRPVLRAGHGALPPVPFEAHNTQALVSSFETLGWLALMIARRRRLGERLRAAGKNPLVGFALVFTVLMILAQTTTGNLGIIARQRVQFLPFLWMLFDAPTSAEGASPRLSSRASARENDPDLQRQTLSRRSTSARASHGAGALAGRRRSSGSRRAGALRGGIRSSVIASS